MIEKKYKLLKKIGQGGYAEVYLAQHKQLSTYKAIKKLSPKNTKEKQRIQREIDILGLFHHPYIIQIDEVMTLDNNIYICMEYAQNGSLKDLLEAKSKLSLEQSMNITHGILKGVQALHNKNILHRDLKPANILFDHSWNPKITDFGIAKYDIDISQQLTHSKELLGTLAYMSPEQIQGKQKLIDQTTDLYAVGVMLYEMITGKHPFKAKNDLQLIHNIIRGNYVPPSRYVKKLDSQLEQFCMKAFNKSKKNRFQNAHNMLENLNFPQSHYSPYTIPRSALIGLSGFFSAIITFNMFADHTSLHKYNDTLNLHHNITSHYKRLSKKPQLPLHTQLYHQRVELYTQLTNNKEQQNNQSITDVVQSEQLYKLGLMYYYGEGAPQNTSQAHEFFKKASLLGSGSAYCQLGKIAEKSQNYTQASHYYLQASQKEHPESLYLLGMLLKNGHLGLTTRQQLLTHFQKALELGYTKAFIELLHLSKNNNYKYKQFLEKGIQLKNTFALKEASESYYYGKYGLQQNTQKAIQYAIQAAKLGNIEALELLLETTPNNIDIVFKNMIRFYNQELTKGNTSVRLPLAFMYLRGYGTPMNYDYAKELYKLAAIEGDGEALHNLGFMYQYGLGVQVDYDKAKQYYQKAILKDNNNALISLARISQPESARSLYQQAINKGNIKAYSHLANLYYGAYNMPEKSLDLYKQAAQYHDAYALVRLGKFYADGIGTIKDVSKAKKLFEQAITLKDDLGIVYLAHLYLTAYNSKENIQKAKKLHEQLLKSNNRISSDQPYPLGSVAMIYREGKYGIERNYAKAIQFLKLGIAKNPNVRLNYLGSIGDLYKKGGYGVEKNYAKARDYYEQSLVHDSSYMFLDRLMVIYEQGGYGLTKNTLKAKKIYNNFIQIASKTILNQLAANYEHGISNFRIDLQKSKELRRLAAQK